MTGLMLFFLFFHVFFCIVEGQSSSAEFSDKKLGWMLEQAHQSSPLIRLSLSAFKGAVASGPRSFSSIVFITASNDQIPCPVCKFTNGIECHRGLSRELQYQALRLATWFEQYRYDDHGFDQGESEKMIGLAKHSVFFFELDALGEDNMFKALSISSVPYILHIPPVNNSSSLMLSALIKDTPAFHQLHLNKWGKRIESLHKFVSSRTSTSLNLVPLIQPSFLEANITLLMFLAMSAMVAALYRIMVALVPGAENVIWYSPVVWFTLTTAFFIFCVSGGVFHFARNADFTAVNSKGKTVYLHPEMGQQLGSEAFIIAVLLTASALLLVLLNSSIFISVDEHGRLRLIPALIILLIVLFLFSHTRSVFTFKSPDYRLGYPWPPYW